MTREWNGRNNWLNPNGGNGKGSCREHDERMREFHRSHAKVAMVNAPRCDQATLIERMELLPVSRTMVKTGGSRFFSGVTDWLALVPVLRVARYKLSQN